MAQVTTLLTRAVIKVFLRQALDQHRLARQAIR